MGFLLKIALVGVAIYAAWKTVARWKGLYDRFVGTPPRPPQAPRPDPAKPAAVVADAKACGTCGTYLAPGAAKCGRSDCPQPA